MRMHVFAHAGVRVEQIYLYIFVWLRFVHGGGRGGVTCPSLSVTHVAAYPCALRPVVSWCRVLSSICFRVFQDGDFADGIFEKDFNTMMSRCRLKQQ